MTPHNEAEKGAFAKTVLMPGDPLRAKYIAENFLTGAKLVNNVRGVQGYTGKYEGADVSVMASGMGMASIGIYAYELYNFYDVENIIRVGSAGSYSLDVRVRDIVVAQGACTDSNFGAQYCLPGTFAPIADFSLLETAVDILRERGTRFHVGNVFSSDVFYNDDSEVVSKWGKMGVLAVEMETAALYMTAARAKKRALSILTVSDHLLTNEETTAAERQTTFNDMIVTALSCAVKMR